MITKSLLIINIDGVLVSKLKYPFFNIDSVSSVYCRHGTIECLEKLLEKFQIVLMSDKFNEIETKRFMKYLESN